MAGEFLLAFRLGDAITATFGAAQSRRRTPAMRKGNVRHRIFVRFHIWEVELQNRGGEISPETWP